MSKISLEKTIDGGEFLQGRLMKSIETIDGVRYIRKEGRTATANIYSNNIAIMEKVASVVGNLLGFYMSDNFIKSEKIVIEDSCEDCSCYETDDCDLVIDGECEHYDPEILHKLVLYSKDFSKGQTLNSIERLLVDRTPTVSIYEYLKENCGEAVIEIIDQIIILDYIICNLDRHLNNILYLKCADNSTIEMAPIFDNELSLLNIMSDKKINRLKKLISLIKSSENSDECYEEIIEIMKNLENGRINNNFLSRTNEENLGYLDKEKWLYKLKNFDMSKLGESLIDEFLQFNDVIEYDLVEVIIVSIGCRINLLKEVLSK